MEDTGYSEAGLAPAIDEVRRELEAAIKAGEKSDGAFKAGPIELEFEVMFTTSGGGEAGVKAWVVTVGGKAEASRARTHRIKVTLTPVDRTTGADKLIGDVGVKYPAASSNAAPGEGDVGRKL